MPDMFDLLIVDYNRCGAGKGVCIAPLWSTKEGEEIETNIGRGIVLYSCTSSKEDENYKIASKLSPVDVIRNKIVPVTFGEDEDDLSEE